MTVHTHTHTHTHTHERTQVCTHTHTCACTRTDHVHKFQFQVTATFKEIIIKIIKNRTEKEVDKTVSESERESSTKKRTKTKKTKDYKTWLQTWAHNNKIFILNKQLLTAADLVFHNPAQIKTSPGVEINWRFVEWHRQINFLPASHSNIEIHWSKPAPV